MSVTGLDLRDRSLEVMLGKVGYTSGNYEKSIFGEAKTWRSKWLNGRTVWQGMYCNRFTSWGTDYVMGANAARAAIGHQTGTVLPAGFAATWLQREWYLRNNRWVGFANAQPGDDILFKLPGRQTNPTNHIGRFYRWDTKGKVAIVIEGNLAKPGVGTQKSIGVHLHYRPITYVVGVYRPNWDAAAKIYNKENPSKPTQPKPPVEKEEDMEKVLAAINKLGIVNLSERTMELLHTGRSSWALSDYLNLIGNRVGRTEGYVLNTRAELAGVKEAVMQISEAAGMNRNDVEKIVTQKIKSSTFSLDIDEGK